MLGNRNGSSERAAEVQIDFAGVVAVELVVAVDLAVGEDDARGDAEEVDVAVPQRQVGVVFVVATLDVEEVFAFGVAFAEAADQAGRDAFAPFLPPAKAGGEAVVGIARAACAFVAEIQSGEPVLMCWS